ncbi:carbamoyltransferase C-terminal domain-containing protein [Kribbella speibonae]|uniref:3-hydroxymethylcephem carbamoyltransferase n=1 Tax=Kribbella speibonae TaxID=1572660 RepID=A0A4R0IU58_9ACTN|nr:carbamoyltransferase C-terminal domain-containing protein [Kribbella speibonae]TCC36280.1 3-hydroxymethylcephem carbamoyltransferase [Kribbella speibonae]
MLILAFNPGHDSAVTVIEDRKLVYCLASEMDSYPRYAKFTPEALLRISAMVHRPPDVVALGGWLRRVGHKINDVAAGYEGDTQTLERSSFFGAGVRYFSSSHERSHIMAAVGMAPRGPFSTRRAVLVWEGLVGCFYLLDEEHRILKRIPVLREPGWRYQFLFGLGDPGTPDSDCLRLEQAGKLMALAGYGDPGSVPGPAVETVDRIMSMRRVTGQSKAGFQDSVLYNIGLTNDVFRGAAALLTRKIFNVFRTAARNSLPHGIPLHIAGGCALNCEWNRMWQSDDQFSSVFVPPCPNDSGSSLGTGIDALFALTGDPHIEWSVYSGLEFEMDRQPDRKLWVKERLDIRKVALGLQAGEVSAWVQGRSEVGPRALGNRSLVAAPFEVRTRDRLNAIKNREAYRPIAPVCRTEDIGEHFETDFEDPYMLYFRQVKNRSLGAVIHADGSARLQTVSSTSNPPLHRLLSEFREVSGAGVLCNTSLNFSGRGFINRMSDLEDYCSVRGVDRMVVGEIMYSRTDQGSRAAGIARPEDLDDSLM